MPRRRLLFVDRELLLDFLADYEGGELVDVVESESRSKDKNVEGTIGVPNLASIKGRKGRDEVIGTERRVRQRAASELGRLHAQLIEDDELHCFSSAHPDEWSRLSPGAIVEATGILQVPGMWRLGEGLDELETVASAIGEYPDEAREELDVLRAVAAASRLGDEIPAVLTVGQPGYRFAMTLPSGCAIAAAPARLEGHVTILGELDQAIDDGERYLLPDRATRLAALDDGLEQALSAYDDPELRELGIVSPAVPGPAFVMAPIAIYKQSQS